MNFIKSNSRLLGGLCNSSLEEHCKQMNKPGTFGTQAELQAASSLLQVPVYIFQKPNELRNWEWMVYNPQSRSQLDFSTCPGLAALQSPNTFDIEILYHAAHFDVITRLNPTALLPFPHLPRENTSRVHRLVITQSTCSMCLALTCAQKSTGWRMKRRSKFKTGRRRSARVTYE